MGEPEPEPEDDSESEGGPFIDTKLGVSGTAYKRDETTIHIKDFHYRGKYPSPGQLRFFLFLVKGFGTWSRGFNSVVCSQMRIV